MNNLPVENHLPTTGSRKPLDRVRTWDIRFLRLCREISAWSKDPGQGVGAVIVTPENRLVSMGFNGLPRSLKDDPDILNDRELKLRMTIHAEINALHFAGRDVQGCTLYSYPIPPCISCASSIIQRGIVRVVTVVNQGHNPRWEHEGAQARRMFNEAAVTVLEYEREFCDQASTSL